MSLPASFGPYPATLVAIHDGDTFTFDIDLGFQITFRFPCRLYGVNAPELATAAGKASLAFLETVLHVGDHVTVVSHGWDKYARFDGQVTLPDGRDLATVMLQAGQAVVYP